MDIASIIAQSLELAYSQYNKNQVDPQLTVSCFEWYCPHNIKLEFDNNPNPEFFNER